MMYHDQHKVYYLGPGDPYVFTEQKRDYGRVAALAEGKVVLDFGAHCGFFNVFLSRNHLPKKIISVEPDKRMFECLLFNVNTDITDIKMAAVVDESFKEDTIPLYLGKTFSATNSVEPYKGRTKVDVSTVSFQELLADSVQFIKCDCEGGEYSLNWRNLPDTVETIAIEFHFNRPEWEDDMMEIDQVLIDQSFEHVKKPKLNTFQKINTGLYVRS